MYGIVYRIGLYMPTLLTILKLDYISIGTTRILFMISQHSCTELEVVVNR